MHPQAGRISHYRVLGELGRDRLGYVLRAKDERLDRPVVLRVVRAASVVPPDCVDDVRAAFQRHAKRAARVSHPNLSTIYAFESIGDVDVIAIEWVDGASLRTMLALGERWRITQAAGLVARIADAIGAAHASNLTHGRLSLANVLIRPDGRLKVVDLGVPKLSDGSEEGEEDRPDAALLRAAERTEDVRGLALIALELASTALRPPGALWRPQATAAGNPAAALADPQQARSRFGGLAPVLRRAFGLTDEAPFKDAVEFRDAILAAIGGPGHPADAKPGEVDDVFGLVTPVVVPRGPAAPASPGAVLDSAAADPADAPRRPRLVLPADLAVSGADLSSGAYVVMAPDSFAARWRSRARALGARLSQRLASVSSRTVTLGVLFLVLLFAGMVAARRYFAGGDASAATLTADSGSSRVMPAASTQPPVPVLEPETTAASTPMADGQRAAMVRATPRETNIRVRGRPDVWQDAVELAVPFGDSLVIDFDRRGYVSQTHTFRGNRLAVSLQPDSIVAFFGANVPAEVYLLEASGALRPIGRTDMTRRMPSGTYRFVFRVPDQPDWTTTQNMAAAGRTYRVVKSDYVAHGSLQVTVAPTWAWISVDGGPNRDSPVRFDGLSAGRHIIRVTRAGYQTQLDTVTIRPGQVLTRPYTLVPTSDRIR